jgi:hypothetical protein
MHKLDLIQHKLAHFYNCTLVPFSCAAAGKEPGSYRAFLCCFARSSLGAVANISVKKTSPVPNTWKWLVE